MRKMQDFIVEGKSVFVGLEDSKRTWKLCVRSEGMVVHETSMPADYGNLRGYFRKRSAFRRPELVEGRRNPTIGRCGHLPGT